jgi:hypothetical protein
MGDQPKQHVRRPDLPWREATLTECGQPIVDVAACLTRPQMRAKWSREGEQRAAYTTCMTCLHTGRRWPEWDEDPVGSLARYFYLGRQDPVLADDLRAIAALIETHRDEFDEYLAGLKDTISLAAVRQARRYPHGAA